MLKAFRVQSGRNLLLIVAVLAGVSGCVTYQTPNLTPEALRAAIRAGEFLTPGAQVSVVTAGAGEREMVDAEVDGEVIRGTDAADGSPVVVPIDDVVSIRVQQLDAGRSAAAAGGWYAIMSVVAALAFGAAFNP